MEEGGDVVGEGAKCLWHWTGMSHVGMRTWWEEQHGKPGNGRVTGHIEGSKKTVGEKALWLMWVNHAGMWYYHTWG